MDIGVLLYHRGTKRDVDDDDDDGGSVCVCVTFPHQGQDVGTLPKKREREGTSAPVTPLLLSCAISSRYRMPQK